MASIGKLFSIKASNDLKSWYRHQNSSFFSPHPQELWCSLNISNG